MYDILKVFILFIVQLKQFWAHELIGKNDAMGTVDLLAEINRNVQLEWNNNECLRNSKNFWISGIYTEYIEICIIV